MTKDDRAYRIADRLYWIFIENTHPSYLNDYIEEDPDNPQGTRNTERGRELFEELEEFVRNTIWDIYNQRLGGKKKKKKKQG